MLDAVNAEKIREIFTGGGGEFRNIREFGEWFGRTMEDELGA